MSYNEANDWSLPAEAEKEDFEAWKKGFTRMDWNKRARALKEIFRGAALKVLLAKHNKQAEEANFYAGAIKKIAFKLRDKIIAAEEPKAYSILEDQVIEWFKIIDYKPHVIYDDYLKQGLIDRPKSLKTENIFGIGLTTYKSGKVENYQDDAWNITYQIIKELLPQLKDIKVIQAFPTIGYWKGTKEPSTQLILKGELSDYNLNKIIKFKEKYHQDAIMLFDPIKDIDKTIENVLEKDLPNLKLDVLTYDFERKRVTTIGKGVRFI